MHSIECLLSCYRVRKNQEKLFDLTTTQRPSQLVMKPLEALHGQDAIRSIQFEQNLSPSIFNPVTLDVASGRVIFDSFLHAR